MLATYYRGRLARLWVVLGLLLCGCLSKASGQDIEGFNVCGGLGAGPMAPHFYQYTIDAEMAADYVGSPAYHMYVTNHPDPGTGITNPHPMANIYHNFSGQAGVVTGAKAWIGLAGTWSTNSHPCSWPPLAQDGNEDGYYHIHMDVYDGAAWVKTGEYFAAWVYGGIWTIQDPNVYNPVAPVAPSGGGPGAALSALNVAVSHRGTAAGGYTVTVTPAFTGSSGVTGASGIFGIVSMRGGSYHVHVQGTDTGATPQAQVADRDIFCPGGKGILLTVAFDAMSVPTYGSGSGSNDAGGSAPTADLFTTLFVPNAGTVTGLQRDMGSFWNWGPFGLIGDLAGLYTTATVTRSTISVPNIVYNVHVAHGSGDYTYVTPSQPSGDTGHTLDSVFDLFTQMAIWPSIRAFMGAAIWLLFAYAVLSRMMPKQQV